VSHGIYKNDKTVLWVSVSRHLYMLRPEMVKDPRHQQIIKTVLWVCISRHLQIIKLYYELVSHSTYKWDCAYESVITSYCCIVYCQINQYFIILLKVVDSLEYSTNHNHIYVYARKERNVRTIRIFYAEPVVQEWGFYIFPLICNSLHYDLY
jgi:hypothetical protein